MNIRQKLSSYYILRCIQILDVNRRAGKGFALVATVIVMSVLIVVVMASISISSMESRVSSESRAEVEARANARMALIEAIGQLQEVAGQDQRATARAAILENPDTGVTLPNRNWLGVWSATYEVEDREWPLIGKAPDISKTDEPYLYKGIYTDMRNHVAELKNGQWKNTLRKAWLVSRRAAEVTSVLDPDDEHVLEILGRGTLGESAIVNQQTYLKDRVLVEKIQVVQGRGNEPNGAYAWYVSDNSQKASLRLKKPIKADDSQALAASALDNPTAISQGVNRPYQNYLTQAHTKIDTVFSHKSTALTANSMAGIKSLDGALGAHFHHFTTNSGGLFTDPVYGGFKKDLTPLLFADLESTRIEFTPPNSALSEYPFSSRYPIIPGQRKISQGPSFAAFRDWGKFKTVSGSIAVDLSIPIVSQKITSSEGWPYGVSDGLSYKGSSWAEDVPKIKPVMTDCRYHYYFSYKGEGSSKKMRTHLIPRVCLWNPYNVEMRVSDLMVLMPNIFGAIDGNRKKRFHFKFNTAEVDRLKKVFTSKAGHKVHRWKNDRIYLRGNQGGLFPADRFLGFKIEGSILAPGECLVFSPKVEKAEETSQGISIQVYNKDTISNNVLSAREPQGEGHFVHDYDSTYQKMDVGTGSEGVVLPSDLWAEMDFDEIRSFEMNVIAAENFNFVLKNGISAGSATAASNLHSSIQSLNLANGGLSVYDFRYYSVSWGDSGSAFGNLARFSEAPRKDAPRLYQVGAKLLWIDESGTEANTNDKTPLRYNVWNSDSLAYNPCLVANWNIRPHLITRSPSSPVGAINGGDTGYSTSSGAWLQQFVPKSPQDSNDMPQLNNKGYFVKPALSLATQSGVPRSMAMFDLPDPNYGALSIAALRHAQLSPFSWHPTYIVGNSLADIHVPYDSSANSNFFQNSYSDKHVNTSWDYAVGGGQNGTPYSHGARVTSIYSDSLLQIGNYKSSVKIDGQSVSHDDEHFAYDINFEVNQNLWDHFFFSGMPMTSNGFDWAFDGSTELYNKRYTSNNSADFNYEEMEKLLKNTFSEGFWYNGYLLKNKAAFNINSTSVEAWIAFISGLRGIDRNGVTAGDFSLYSRFREPDGSYETEDVGVESKAGWGGGRKLTDSEIKNLAMYIVREVKQRGPFISLADFVNRRLAPSSDMNSRRGALESAIAHSGLNDHFNQEPYLAKRGSQNDNNHVDFKPDLEKQPVSKAWGIPGYITQADLLEPLAPAMTVRGDVFVIRCYGESRDSSGNIRATAFLEATVERSSEYMASANINVKDGELAQGTNRASDPALTVDRVTGQLREGNLSEVNKRFGRRFLIKSIRWMNKDEI